MAELNGLIGGREVSVGTEEILAAQMSDQEKIDHLGRENKRLEWQKNCFALAFVLAMLSRLF